MIKLKYYAVKQGHAPGIYTSYEDYCRAIYLAPHHVSKICKNQQIAENFLTTDYQYTKEWESYCQFENLVNGSYKLNSNIDYQGSPEGYQYVCWVDGGSRGGTHYRNNPSGWAFYIVSAHDKRVYKGCGAGFGETNNLMEMMSLYQALVCLIRIGANPDKVLFVSDSKYVVNSFGKWLPGWQSQGFARKNGELKNSYLWKEIWAMAINFRDLSIHWVKGHSNDIGNLKVDYLVNHAMSTLETQHLQNPNIVEVTEM